MLALHGPGWRQPQPIGVDDEDEEDDAYENELVCLLGRMEQMRDGLAMAREGRRTAQAFAFANDLMEQVIAFADNFCANRCSEELNDAVMRVSEFYGVLKPLRDLSLGSNVRSLLGMGNRSNVAAEPQQAKVRLCFNALYAAVFAYFVAFTNRFPTSRAARPWVEVAATFVVDFKRTLRDPQPSIPGA
jgi:hypothetical protein